MAAIKECFSVKNLAIFILFAFIYKLTDYTHASDKAFDCLLCRQCGHEVMIGEHLINVPSTESKHAHNVTILGRNNTLVQMFKNPQGHQFEVITAKKADVLRKDHAYSAFSWFAGFLWHIAVCPRCGAHLGWSFEPSNPSSVGGGRDLSFVGLILEHLLHEDYANSLLITPKSYYS